MTERDWYAWHAPYDNPDSGLSRRLSWVQGQIRAVLDSAPGRAATNAWAPTAAPPLRAIRDIEALLNAG